MVRSDNATEPVEDQVKQRLARELGIAAVDAGVAQADVDVRRLERERC